MPRVSQYISLPSLPSRRSLPRTAAAAAPVFARPHGCRHWRRSGSGRRGAAVTEFAIIAPIFFMMIIGFIEFGRALMVQQVLINASRVGARQAITTGATQSEVEAAVQDYTAGVTVGGVNVSVSPSPQSAAPGTLITVTTTVDFNSVSWMATPWFLGGKQLTASSQMRKEGFQ